MLTYRQDIELVRQSEKSNMTLKQEELLKDWAIQSLINSVLLQLVFDGCVDITKMDDEPSFTLTDKGAMIAGTDDLEEVIEQIMNDPGDYDYDNDDNYDDDYDEDDYDNDDQEIETVMALGRSAEEIKLKVKVLQSLCHRLGIETE